MYKFLAIVILVAFCSVFVGCSKEQKISSTIETIVQQEQVCVIGESLKYHTPECRYVKIAKNQNKTIKQMGIKVAENLKFTPCKVCK